MIIEKGAQDQEGLEYDKQTLMLEIRALEDEIILADYSINEGLIHFLNHLKPQNYNRCK